MFSGGPGGPGGGFGGFGGAGPGPGHGGGPGFGGHGSHGHFGRGGRGHGHHGGHPGGRGIHGHGPGFGGHGGGGFFGGMFGGFFSPSPTISTRGGSSNSSHHPNHSERGNNMSNQNDNQSVSKLIAATSSCHFARIAIILAAASVGSNFLATKIWTWGGFTFDGGLFLYPLTFIMMDVLVEVFGREAADFVNTKITKMNILIFVLILLVNRIPTPAGIESADLSILYGRNLRIIPASIIGYYISHWVNNWAHAKAYNYTTPEQSGLRSIVSSAFGHIVDTPIFNGIAFFGTMGTIALIKHMVYAYLAAMLIELVVFILRIIPRLSERYINKINAGEL